MGAVSLDTAEGDGYGVSDGVDSASIALHAGPATPASPYGVSALVTDLDDVGIPGRTVAVHRLAGDHGPLLVLRA